MTHSVFLGELLPASKGESPSFLGGKPKDKSDLSFNTNGVDWYPVLVRNENLVSLTDVIGEQGIREQFLVCFTSPSDTRHFAAFKSILDFTSYIRKVPMDNWFFFEVIPGQRPQKLYFDIDVPLSSLTIQTQDELDRIMSNVLSTLVGRVCDRFWERSIQLDLERDFLLFSSHAPHKRSLHLVIDNYAFSNHLEIQALVREILEGFPEEWLSQKFVDPKVYSSLQQLRLFGSQKPGSNRPKVFVEQWYYGPRVVKCKFLEDFVKGIPDQTTKDALTFNLLFAASCVTSVNNCRMIQILAPNSPEIVVRRRRLDDARGLDLTEELVDLIKQRLPPVLLQIYKVSGVEGPFVDLKRRETGSGKKVENLCTLCNHVHQSENAYLRVSDDGKVFFYCWRNPSYSSEVKCKLMTTISDRIPNQLIDRQKESVMKQLAEMNARPISTPCQVSPPVMSSPPLIETVHSRLRNIAVNAKK